MTFILPRSLSLLLLCAALLSATPAWADPAGIKGARSTTPRRLDKIKGPEERECEFSEKDDEVEFECKSKTGDSSNDNKSDEASDSVPEPQTRGITITPDQIEDKLKYSIKTTNEGIRVKLEYKQEIETEATETETKTKFEIIFDSLVEYVKAGSDSGADVYESQAYDWDADEIVQTIPLNNWDAIPGVVSDEAGIVSHFTATAWALADDDSENDETSDSSGGTVEFTFHVSRADLDEHISANSMKIDVRIIDFPWTRSDSYVALISTLESKKKVKMEYDDEATVSTGGKAKKTKDVSISFGEEMEPTLGFTTYGQYTWEEEAEASGAANGTVMMARQGTGSNNNVVLVGDVAKSTIEVIATSPTSLGNETYQSIAYSFVGDGAHSASEIYWDPETGIGYETSAAISTLSSIMGLAGSVISALFVLVW